jgi:hypothetical protein
MRGRQIGCGPLHLKTRRVYTQSQHILVKSYRLSPQIVEEVDPEKYNGHEVDPEKYNGHRNDCSRVVCFSTVYKSQNVPSNNEGVGCNIQ